MGAVDAVSVVDAYPGGKGVGSVLVAGEGLAVGPFDGHGAVEAFDFAVLPRAVRLDELLLGPERGDGVSEGDRVAVGEGVVADHAPDLGDAVSGEVGGCAGQEPGGGGSFFVRVDLGVGQAGVVVDGCVDVVEANASCADLLAASVGAPAPTVGDAPELLDVDVYQVAGSLVLVAGRGRTGCADQVAGDGVESGQPRDVVTDQDPGNRACWDACEGRQACWAEAVLGSCGQHRLLTLGAGLGGHRPGPLERSISPLGPWARYRRTHR